LQNETEAAVSKTETSTVDRTTKAATVASTVETANVEKQEYESEVKIEFDTEKPINDDTGLPPVKSITTKEKGRKTSEDTAKTSDYAEDVLKTLNAAHNSQTDSTGNNKETEEITEASETKESQFLKWVAVISLSIAVIFAVITIKKALKGTSVLKWIKGLFK
jgi:hypothetical protein